MSLRDLSGQISLWITRIQSIKSLYRVFQQLNRFEEAFELRTEILRKFELMDAIRYRYLLRGVIHSFIHSFLPSFLHSFIHSFIHNTQHSQSIVKEFKDNPDGTSHKRISKEIRGYVAAFVEANMFTLQKLPTDREIRFAR